MCGRSFVGGRTRISLLLPQNEICTKCQRVLLINEYKRFYKPDEQQIKKKCFFFLIFLTLFIYLFIF